MLCATASRGGVGQIVDRQDDDVVAHADAAVLAAITPEVCCIIDSVSDRTRLTTAWS